MAASCRPDPGDGCMHIRAAEQGEYPAVRAFYHSVIDAMQSSPYDIGWEKDIYPSPELLRESIENGELFLGLVGDMIAASMILNHRCNEGYRQFAWPTKAESSEVTIIHALAVHPRYAGTGLGKQLVTFAIESARKDLQKAIRLDVLKGNVPAERLYASMGFKCLHTLPMYYEDTGWTDFELYELSL
ncbi:MAG: GNAT family N-acetyltransferase [Atopobiaceae bacterium]